MVGEELDNAMHFFGEMMQEIQQLKKEHSAWIEQLDEDIADYIKKICTQEAKKMER